MGKAIVYGKEQAVTHVPISGEFTEFELVTHVTLEKTRSESHKISLDYKEEDIIQLTFDDQTQWIGNAADVYEVYGLSASSSRSGDAFVFDANIQGKNATRGTIGTIIVKTLSLFRPKIVADTAEVTGKELAQAFDAKLMRKPGVFKMTESFGLITHKRIQKKEEAYLLLIHGTMSNTQAAFEGLTKGENNVWQQIFDFYRSGILALEHYTLSTSPLQNALDFLETCESGVTLDIMSHSRGGLVADILAKCDKHNDTIGFSDLELGMMAQEDPQAFDLMQAINEIALKKKITIRKVIRVAAPASGTTILGRRIDHFFNVILNALGLAAGAFANVAYNTVKTFLLELIKQRTNPESMPGLYSMVPDSAFQKMLNNSGVTVASELFVISGDAEAGGRLGSSIVTILANLYYWKSNDLVVDTHRMDHGAPRVAGIYKYVSADSKTNHFNYFKNQNTSDAILQAITSAKNEKPSLYTWVNKEGMASRGVVLDLFSMKGVHYDEVSGKRNIAILLPGIMGSSLDSNNENQWIDFKEMSRGGIKENLQVGADGVKASGVIKKFYDKFVRYLMDTHDVVTFPFDWRLSVTVAAKDLAKKIEGYIDDYNQPIHLIAHSMGGLVVRQVMIDFPDLWKRFITRTENKFVMLGTPWLGSYLVMEVLTGHSSRVKQLAMIDFKNDKKDLMQVFREYTGIFELLPIQDSKKRPFWTSTFWKDRKSESGSHMVVPLKRELDAFKKYHDTALKFVQGLKKKDFDNIYYVAGMSDQTVYDYKTESRFLSKKKKLVYLATTHGDGSVTWATGIPSRLSPENLYYTRTSHGDLANDEDNFEGIRDILLEGKTTKLLTDKPLARSGEIISEIHGVAEPLHNPEEVSHVIFGVKPRLASDKVKQTPVTVSVINADLKVSSYPVMVGHFYNDGVYSAESALDSYLDKRLSQRHNMGYYPGKIGESEVFFNLNTNPHGAIVCGLGVAHELTHYLLAKTIEMATLKYAMFMRDNYTLSKAKKYAEGISFILIGTGYGKLQVDDSVKGIILGVSQANDYIRLNGEGLREITQVEIVNYYESLASQAYWALNRLKGSDSRFKYNLVKGITAKEGAKKRRAFVDDNNDWWHHFNIKSIRKNDEIRGFSYNSSAGLARVEEEEVHNGMAQLGILLEQMSQSSQWDKRLSKTLFELLIPNRFKDVIRNQNNIIFKLDIDAAQFPWEMFYDSMSDDIPAAVNSGLIRQLLTSDYEVVQLRSAKDTALVIGDPIYNTESLPQLPAAEIEAKMVAQKLNLHEYDTQALIRTDAKAIMMQLYSGQYKILHFSGHGLYEPEHGKVGIAIGDGICINPAMIKQMSYVPEFVFINCCYSGKVVSNDNSYTRSRYKLAANVGTQLIQMGVKAIIITGWAVDDNAAATFAEVFYNRMIEGYEFGEAVQLARKKCFQDHSYTNTWGAYQCYGNQHYKFHDLRQKKEEVNEYVLPSQVYIDMDNLYASIKHKKYNAKKALNKLEIILENAQRNDLMDGVIREREALIYDELNMADRALETFKSVLTLEDANFSMKVLEHFCLLRSMNLSENADERQEELETITKLALIGKTTLRLGIVGNAWKFASLFETGEERIKYLKKALASYQEAYSIKTDPYDGQYLDAFSNIVFLGFLLEKEGVLNLQDLFDDFTEQDPITFLKEQYTKLDDLDPNDMDISALLGMTEAGFCLLLLSEENIDKILKDINSRFHLAFQLLHSSRQIRIELAQLDFLLAQPFEAEKLEGLNKIKESLLRYQ